MKKTILFFTVLMMCAVHIFSQTQTFEGTYDMEITSATEKSHNTSMKIYIKGEKAMFEPMDKSHGSFKMITDAGKKENIMLMDNGGQKIAMKMPMKDIVDKQQKKDPAVKEPKITQTAETKVIEGYTCKKVIIEDPEEGTTIEMWITKETGIDMYRLFGAFSGAAPMGGQQAKSPMKNYEIFKDAIALESTITDKKGKVTVMKIKNIAKKVIPTSTFDISGYQLMDVGGMMKGMSETE